MYIISVIPISKTFRGDDLSYFSKDPLTQNTLVKISLQRKTVPAMVRDCKDLKTQKTAVRSSHFKIKKIEGVIAENFYTDAFISACEMMAVHYVTSLAVVLCAFTPKHVLSYVEKNSTDIPLETAEKLPAKKILQNAHRQALQAPLVKRMSAYEALFRKALRKEGLVFLAVPDLISGERFFEQCEKEFPEETIFIHGGQTKKKLHENIGRMQIMKKGVVIGTPSFLSALRSSPTLIVLEDASNTSYRMKNRPYFDRQIFTEYFAEVSGADLFFAGLVLSPEIARRIAKKEIKRGNPFQETIEKPGKTRLVDMRPFRKDEKGFALLEDEGMSEIKKALAERKKIFLYAVRRGLSGLTVCRDCGDSVLCRQCDAPLALENSPTERIFRCGYCAKEERARDRLKCGNCGGIHLQAFGIGVDHVAQEVLRIFPNVSLIQVDAQKTKTPGGVKKAISKFNNESKHSPTILVGTEKTLKYIDSVDLCVIVSIDSLFAIPDFRLGHKIFSLLCQMSSFTREALFIETRNPDSDLIKTFLKGNINDFVEKDLKDRERFDFPPSTKLIKITARETTKRKSEQIEKLENFFSDYHPLVYPGFVPRVKDRFVIHTLLTLPPGASLPEDLEKRLRSLPPNYEIRMDPESIL